MTMRGEYKTCIDYRMTRAGRRCAEYGPGSGLGLGADDYKCVKYKRVCLRRKRSLKRFGRRKCVEWEQRCVESVLR